MPGYSIEIFATEREGFEPSLKLPLNSISSAAPSTARPSLQSLTTVAYMGNGCQLVFGWY
jgi:hypothetical protein